jgi:hypothetical protein
MTNQNQSIEERIIKNEVKLSDDFQKVVQDNEVFKNDVRAEMMDFVTFWISIILLHILITFPQDLHLLFNLRVF